MRLTVHPQRWTMAGLNVVGGIAVLGSYWYGFATHPEAGDALWGGVPLGLRPLYTASMLLAAVGYFPLTAFLLFCVDPDRVRIAGRFGYGWFNLSYALVLLPSALWMPLALRVIGHWDLVLWWTIRVILALVGLGSLGLLAALLMMTPRRPLAVYRLAVVGAVFFCIQTALLDALVWPAFFPPG
jgi:hypothetical protein